MTAFEKRLAKLEAEHRPAQQERVSVRFWTSPAGMTDLVKQEAWLEAQIGTNPEQVPGRTLNVHFVRHVASELLGERHTSQGTTVQCAQDYSV